MTGEEAIAYLDSYCRETHPGLWRMRALMTALGNPQDTLRYIHIAGTNGKGSTAAMLESILRAAGYRTGLYTSPYIQKFNERMQVCGVPIEDDELGAVTERVRACAQTMSEAPNEFELITAVAFCYFAQHRCEAVVLEVGLGGEFDATNVIAAPEAAVIANIGLDHTELLGDTLGKIAGAKAGIIKEGCLALTYPGEPEVEAVYADTCKKKHAEWIRADFSNLTAKTQTLDGQTFDWKNQRDLFLPLIGAHQLKNAAVVLTTVEALRGRGWSISNDAVREGLRSVRWPVRFEVVCRDPLFVIDGGHNPQCLQTVSENLKTFFPGRYVVLLTGMLRDKDTRTMTSILTPVVDEIITVPPDSLRALPAEALAEEFRAAGGKTVRVCKDVREGVALAMADASAHGGVVCAAGSLYLAGEVRSCFF